MLFNSLEFVLFFAVVYPLYLVSRRRAQNVLLTVASYIFYGAWDWRFLSLIVISTAVDFYCGKRVRQARTGRIFLWISLLTNLGLLGFFKYFNWFADSLVDLLKGLGIEASGPALHVLLPVGISFYTFQTLSYTLDIWRGKLEPVEHWLDFALFVSFFPQLVAGPIERAKTFLPQLTAERQVTLEDLQRGIWLISFGLFMKLFVADNLSSTVDAAYASGAHPSGSEALVATYAFAFQIFGDFAGYSSIAIGLTRLMGMTLMTNFRFPYFVTNPQDFWRDWHISLSTWLRDYLYISLGGNRGGAFKTYRNLFLTMLLGGLWHGAAWNFLIWGLYQGLVLCLHRWLSPILKACTPRGPLAAKWMHLLCMLGMFHVTCLGWLIFRAQSLEQILSLSGLIARDALTLTPGALVGLKTLLFYVSPLLLIQLYQYRKQDLYAILRLRPGTQALVYTLMFFLIFVMGELGASEFIYFQF